MAILSISGRLDVRESGIAIVGPDPNAALWGTWDGSNNGSAQVLSIGTGTQYHRALYQMDTDKMMLGYLASTAPQYPRAVILSRTGDTVTAGTPVVIASIFVAAGGRYSIGPDGTDRAIAYFRNASNNQDAYILTVSGTTISAGAVNTDVILKASSNPPDTQNIINLDTNRHMNVYCFEDNDSTTAQVSTNSGAVVTTDGTSGTDFDSADSATIFAVGLDTTRVVTAARVDEAGDPNHQEIRIQVLENPSGTTVNSGAASFIDDGANFPEPIVLIPIDANHAFLAYTRPSTGRTYARIYTFSGTTITDTGTETEISTSSYNQTSEGDGPSRFAQMTPTEFMFIYRITPTANQLYASVVRFPTSTTFSIDVADVSIVSGGGTLRRWVIENLDASANLLVYDDNNTTTYTKVINQ